MEQRTYWKTVKRYFGFNKKESKSLIISIVVLGFIVSFADWGYETFDIYIGLRNLFSAMVIIALALMFRQFGSRLFAHAACFTASITEI